MKPVIDRFSWVTEPIDTSPDIMDGFREKMADSLAKQLEEEVFACIDARLGPFWNPDTMVKRVRRIGYAEHPYEDYTLDGALMLRVWPVSCKLENMTLTASRDFKRFP